MASTTQTLEAYDLLLWDTDFSNCVDLDAELGVEELCSKFANEETQEPPTGDSQETKKTSLDLSGTGNPTIDIATMEQTPGPLIQACPESAEEIAAEPIHDPMPVLEAEKIEAQMKYLRHKLQKGLLTKGQLPKEENIHEMSSYLSKLEGLGSPPGSAISKMRICTLLKAIQKLDEIPRDDELHVKKRAKDLRDKWKPILDAQPKVIDLREESEVVEPIKAPQPGVTDMTEEFEVVEPIKAPQPEVIDLTEESEVVEPIKAPQAEDVTTLSLQDIHFCKGTWHTIPCDNWPPKPDSTSSALKRKFSDTTPDSETTASCSSTFVEVGDERPTPRRTKRKTLVQNYVRKESLWMKDALNGIKELLSENKRQNVRLLEFKELMQSWGTRDEKITKEWEQSS